MVVINIKKQVIPIDFGEFQLEFSKSDANLKKLTDFGKELEEKGKVIVENADDNDVIDKAKEILELAYDGVFGQGSFDKVYALSGESTIDVLNYFFEAMDGIVEEYSAQKDKELLKKYLGS